MLPLGMLAKRQNLAETAEETATHFGGNEMAEVPTLEAKGYIKSLFDFKFASFVTRRVIKVLYALITVIYSLGAVVFFIAMIARHTAGSIVVAIVVTPLAYLIYLTIARITLEVLMVIFGIGEDVREMREAAVGKGSTSSGA